MQKRIGYNVRLLVEKLFPCHVLKQIVTEYDSEDYYKEKKHWYISYPENNLVRFYNSTFSTSQTIYSNEGEELKAHSSNVNSEDISIPRINKLKNISPVLTMIDENYAEATDELNEWIYRNFVVDNLAVGETIPDVLQASSKTFEIDYVMEFKGCCTPCFSNGFWAYSSNTLELSGSEINNILNSITEELTRKKVECIFREYGKKVYNA